MIKSLSKLGLLYLLTLSLTGIPSVILAQGADKPAVENKDSKARKPAVTPFNGKLKEINPTAKTISVGNRTLQVTSETRITKDGKPALLADGVVGEQVSGAFNAAADGKLMATVVNFGKKPETEKKPKKEKE